MKKELNKKELNKINGGLYRPYDIHFKLATMYGANKANDIAIMTAAPFATPALKGYAVKNPEAVEISDQCVGKKAAKAEK